MRHTKARIRRSLPQARRGLNFCNHHIEIETQFLQSVLSLKKDLEKRKKITVGEKLGHPRFKPVDKIKSKNIDKEWITLHDYLLEQGIYFYVRNPSVSSRELYRFVTEELFELEVDNPEKEGLLNCFVYDEFYPDYKYENQKIAVNECIRCFFEKKDFFEFHFSESIKVNRFHDISKKQLLQIIKFFRSGYDEVKNLQVTARNCSIKGYHCRVTGNYKAGLVLAAKEYIKAGRWTVEFMFDPLTECWNIFNIQIKGLAFYLPLGRIEPDK